MLSLLRNPRKAKRSRIRRHIGYSAPPALTPFKVEEVPVAVPEKQPTPSMESVNKQYYLPLKVLKDVIPTFNGTECPLSIFIQRCETFCPQVHPSEQQVSLAIIYDKVIGSAAGHLNIWPQPKSVSDILNALKVIYTPNFNLVDTRAKFLSVTRDNNGTTRDFGDKIIGLLRECLEDARLAYSGDALKYVEDTIQEKARECFLEGLRDAMVRVMFVSTIEKEDLHKTIITACGLEADLHRRHRPGEDLQAVKPNSDVSVTNSDDQICYACEQPGHPPSRCPKNRRHVERYHRVKCSFCNKLGHMENKCFRKYRFHSYRR